MLTGRPPAPLAKRKKRKEDPTDVQSQPVCLSTKGNSSSGSARPSADTRLLIGQGIVYSGLRHTLAWCGELYRVRGVGLKESPRRETLPSVVYYTIPASGNHHRNPRKIIKPKSSHGNRDPAPRGSLRDRAQCSTPGESFCLSNNRPVYASLPDGRSEPITPLGNWSCPGYTPRSSVDLDSTSVYSRESRKEIGWKNAS